LQLPLLSNYYPQFLALIGQQVNGFPKYVRSEFETYSK
jgi:hypothetical protein